MMRNLALGAVIGFGIAVLLLTVFSRSPAPAAPTPVAAAVPPPALNTERDQLALPDGGMMMAKPAMRTERSMLLRNVMQNRAGILMRAPQVGIDAGS